MELQETKWYIVSTLDQLHAFNPDIEDIEPLCFPILVIVVDDRIIFFDVQMVYDMTSALLKVLEDGK